MVSFSRPHEFPPNPISTTTTISEEVYVVLQEMLAPCVEVGLVITQLRELTGRQEPTVIT
jgi:hypothetical protein